MDRKGFAPIIILLVVAGVLIVGGVLYYKLHSPNVQPQLAPTPTPAPAPSPASAQPLSSGTKQNQGWKTYTNNELGFSFQYPQTYSAVGASLSPGAIFHIQGPIGQPYLDVDFENFAYTNSIDPQNTTIGANAFHNMLVNAADDRYFFDLHGKELIFWFSLPTGQTGTSASETDELARQILETFSVETSANAQPSSSQIPSGWKTYSNSQYSLTLDYPGDLMQYEIPYDKGGASPLIFFAHPTGTPPNSGNDEFLDLGSILLTISSPGQSQSPLSCEAESSGASLLPTYCTPETVNGNQVLVLITYLPALNDPTYQRLVAEKTIIFQNQALTFQLSSMVDANVNIASLQSTATMQQSLKSYASQTFDVDRVAATFSFPKSS